MVYLIIRVNTEAEIKCFANNTVILIHDKNIEELYIKANVIFNDIKLWFDNNLLEFILNKTKHIVFNITNQRRMQRGENGAIPPPFTVADFSF
jgi:hypothetical protein